MLEIILRLKRLSATVYNYLLLFISDNSIIKNISIIKKLLGGRIICSKT